MNESIALGKAVREIRQSQEKSIGQLAKELGCSTVMLSRLESGIATISATMLTRIAKTLDVSVEALHSEAEIRQEKSTFTSKDMNACIALLEELSAKGLIEQAHSLLAATLAEVDASVPTTQRQYA